MYIFIGKTEVPEAHPDAHIFEIPDSNLITQKMVDDFITGTVVCTLGTKTTLVQAFLKNGFVLTESSTCVDEKNYNEQIGKDICMQKIKDKIWELLGFLLQTAVYVK